MSGRGRGMDPTLYRVRCIGLRRMCSRRWLKDREMLVHGADANLLQNCRFHCAYFPDGDDKFIYGENGNPDYQVPLNSYEAEADYIGCVNWQASVGNTNDFDESEFPDMNLQILRRAWDVFHHKRFLGKCKDCEAQLPHDSVPQRDNGCGCEMWSHFVGLRWLCIDCFIVEEATANEGVQLERVVGLLAVQVSLI